MSDPARVFMIGWEYPPFNSGGLGVACEGITQALSQQNAQIFFTLPHTQVGNLAHMKLLTCVDPSWDVSPEDQDLYGPAPFAAYASTTSIETIAKSDNPSIDQHVLSSLPQSELESKVDQYAQQVLRQGEKYQRKYDVIHAHDWMSFPAGVALAKATNKPLIAHVHSTEHDRIPSGTGSQYIHHVEYEGVQAATRVVAVSDYTKRLLIDRYMLDPAKIDVVHNGITALDRNTSIERNAFAQDRPVIVFMGRLTAQKGAPYFLALASQVLRRIPEALFIVAGDGDMYHELLLSTAFQRLSASVLFSGFVRDAQRDKLLDRADVFVMPSLSEPFGLVALEAAQRKTSVIISKNAGVSEVLHGAIALDFWDLNKMTDAIVSLIGSQGLAEQVVAEQTKNLSSITWENTASRLRQSYARALYGHTL